MAVIESLKGTDWGKDRPTEQGIVVLRAANLHQFYWRLKVGKHAFVPLPHNPQWCILISFPSDSLLEQVDSTYIQLRYINFQLRRKSRFWHWGSSPFCSFLHSSTTRNSWLPPCARSAPLFIIYPFRFSLNITLRFGKKTQEYIMTMLIFRFGSSEAGYTARQSQKVGQGQWCKNRSQFRIVTDLRATDRQGV